MRYQDYVREVKDFPKKGVNFKDISPLLGDKEVFKNVIEELSLKVASIAENADISEFLIVAMDARGFILGSPVAYELGCGVVMARKKGKLPGKVATVEYELEYGYESVQVDIDMVRGKKLIVVDDVLATGGTMRAVVDAITIAGGSVIGVVSLIELEQLDGRNKLEDVQVDSLIKY